MATWGGSAGGGTASASEMSVLIVLETLKMINAGEVGGFLISTKHLQDTLKFLLLIGSRLHHQLPGIRGFLTAAKEAVPCRLRQDGGCKNATRGLQVCVHHNDFQIRFYSFHNRDEIFFFYLSPTIKIYLR